MLSSTLQDAFNSQINRELYSSYLYLSMAAYLESASLPGFAHWMRLQHEEELAHAMKLFDFVNDRNGRVTLLPIGQPPVEFESTHSVVQQTLEHERTVTADIHRLYELAHAEKDYAAHVLLEWFIDEQVEEERAVTEILDHMNMIGDDGTGLLMLDARMGERSPAEPTPAES